ncbi:MAG TPA: serine/threonine-protein kinase, partial [Kofleriaceae bacterium]
KPVALKRIQHKLLESRHLAIDMFLNEAKIAGRLTHPNIVQVLDVGEVNGALYLAMEYVRGKDLRDIMKKLKNHSQNVPLGIACYVIREVAQALHHAYWSTDLNGSQLSVVHRDVSPHNVIIGYDGSVKLLDFGVAMSAVTEHAQSVIVGKWMYMSPEHSGSSPLDHRSDLFSLGICLYLLVTGQLPFQANDPKQVIAKIRSGQYRPPLEVAPDLPPALAQLIEAMLAPNPDERPQSGYQVAATLTEIARSYGIESSATQISDFIADVFADEINVVDTGRMQLATGSGSEANEPQMTPSEGYQRQSRASLSPFPTPNTHRTSGSIPIAPRTTGSLSIPGRSSSLSIPGVDRRSANLPISGVDRRVSGNVPVAPPPVQMEVDGDSMNPETKVSAGRPVVIPQQHPIDPAAQGMHQPMMPMPNYPRPQMPAQSIKPAFKIQYLIVAFVLIGLVIAAYFIVNPS